MSDSYQYWTSGGVYVGRYMTSEDVDDWPSGTQPEDKSFKIDVAEDILERATKSHFYAKPFDIRVDGNAKNRILLPLRADLLSVSSIKVWGVILDPAIWYIDSGSICINYEVGIGGYPELLYTLSEFNRYAMFPRGLGNIHVVGTYGKVEFANLAKRVAIILTRDQNEPGLYLHYMELERTGSWDYRIPREVADAKGLTGIKEADDIIKLFRRGKLVIMAP